MDYRAATVILTQLFYVHPGHEAEYRAFEDAVIPLLARHGGELLLRLRPDAAAVIGGSLEAPYELQLVQFATADGLASYLADDDRQRVLHLKQASMREVWVVEGGRPVR